MEAKIANGILTLTIPLTGTAPTSSGKNVLLASTSGFVQVAEGVKVSVNVIGKPKPPKTK